VFLSYLRRPHDSLSWSRQDSGRRPPGAAKERRPTFTLAVLLIAVGFGVYLIRTGMKDLVGDMVKLLVGAGLGTLGGWGLRGHYDQRKKDRSAMELPMEEDEE
jgi:hypothetical protein